MKQFIYLMGCLAGAAACLAADSSSSPVLYQNDFNQAEVGVIPDDFLVLDGDFAVREEGGEKFLELPGAPLESFGFLFGPTEEDGIAASVKVQGTRKGRLFPTFAVGVNGLGGYRLQVSPAKRAIELYKGDLVQKTVPYRWESGDWTTVHLQVRKVGDTHWKLEGKVWSSAGEEPKEWTVTHDETEDLWAGRPTIWGMPYAGTPIRYDDLKVISLKEKKDS